MAAVRGETGGALRTTDEALPWDLDDRLAHHRLEHDGRRVSTLDRIGDGLTVFAGTADRRWAEIVEQTALSTPLDEVILDAGTTRALGLGPTGAVLVRPDGHEVARWSAPASQPEPGVAWL